MNRPVCDTFRNSLGMTKDKKMSTSEVCRAVRRSKPKKRDSVDIVLMYANIQGFTGKNKVWKTLYNLSKLTLFFLLKLW